MQWLPERQAGLDQLQNFLPLAGNRYSKGRNLDSGRFENNSVSGLSPWIRCGLISEIEVLEATRRQHSPNAAEKFIQEVFWRGYFKGWLQQRPQLWLDYQHQLTGLVVEYEKHLGYRAAVAGETGIACFDAWARELVETGYLHNHSRMWFASIWIFTLKLPWQLGADFFLRHLLDGDPAANTLSWRWVGGLHTRGKTYLARPDNISRYTAGRFDPVSGLATTAHPLLEEHEYSRCKAEFKDEQPTTAHILLLTDDCCHADTVLSLDNTQAVFGLLGTAGNVSEQVQHFRDQAVRESCARIAEQQGIAFTSGSFSHLLDWVKQLNIGEIITVAPAIGPTAEMLNLLQTRLQDLDIRLLQQSRLYDRLCWPHATAGFFKLKTRIPSILEALDLSAGGQQSLSF